MGCASTIFASSAADGGLVTRQTEGWGRADSTSPLDLGLLSAGVGFGTPGFETEALDLTGFGLRFQLGVFNAEVGFIARLSLRVFY